MPVYRCGRRVCVYLYNHDLAVNEWAGRAKLLALRVIERRHLLLHLEFPLHLTLTSHALSKKKVFLRRNYDRYHNKSNNTLFTILSAIKRAIFLLSSIIIDRLS